MTIAHPRGPKRAKFLGLNRRVRHEPQAPPQAPPHPPRSEPRPGEILRVRLWQARTRGALGRDFAMERADA
jgi:hypothetical protein